MTEIEINELKTRVKNYKAFVCEKTECWKCEKVKKMRSGTWCAVAQAEYKIAMHEHQSLSGK